MAFGDELRTTTLLGVACSPATIAGVLLVAQGFAVAGKRAWALRLTLVGARWAQASAVALVAWAVVPMPQSVLRFAWRAGPYELCVAASAVVVAVALAVHETRRRGRIARRRERERERHAVGYRDLQVASGERGRAIAMTATLRAARRAVSRRPRSVLGLMAAMAIGWIVLGGLVAPAQLTACLVPAAFRTSAALAVDLVEPRKAFSYDASRVLRARGAAACDGVSALARALAAEGCDAIGAHISEQRSLLEQARALGCALPPTRYIGYLGGTDPPRDCRETLCSGRMPSSFVELSSAQFAACGEALPRHEYL